MIKFNINIVTVIGKKNNACMTPSTKEDFENKSSNFTYHCKHAHVGI
jgi:hypothetical protein